MASAWAIASPRIETGKPVLAVEGDSAFWFFRHEVETICRYKLPVCIVIFNMTAFIAARRQRRWRDPAPTVFVKGSLRQDDGSLAATGVNVTSPDELKRAVNERWISASRR